MFDRRPRANRAAVELLSREERGSVVGHNPVLLGATARLGGGDGAGDAVDRPAVLCRVGLDLVVGVHCEHPLAL